MTYTITASNAGPAPVTTTITDRLPKALKLVSAATGCTSKTDKGITTVTCTVGPIAPTANGQISITVTPSSAGTVTNTVTEDANAVDLTPPDNTATLTTAVQR